MEELASLVRHNDNMVAKIREKLWEEYFLSVDNARSSLQRRVSFWKRGDTDPVYVITVDWEEELELALATMNIVVDMFLDE